MGRATDIESPLVASRSFPELSATNLPACGDVRLPPRDPKIL